ncbi:TPA: hypothetical protein ACH3X2_010556 [Trebouxia sp. C0005]
MASLRYWTVLDVFSLLALGVAVGHRVNDPLVPSCHGLKIAIFDVSDLAKDVGYEGCNLQREVHVDPNNGIVYPAGFPCPEKPQLGGFYLSVNAGPWFLGEAIRDSQYFVSDVEQADIVYINDFCYYIRWLAFSHSHLASPETQEMLDWPGESMNAAYDALLASPRWQRNQGSDFVLYESHSGFRMGSATEKVWGKLCDTFKVATNIIHNRPMRATCPGRQYWDMNKLIVAPYVPNFIASHSLQSPVLPAAPSAKQRTYLLYFKGRCTGKDRSFVGMTMRSLIVDQVNAHDTSARVDVSCTDRATFSHDSFDLVTKGMQRSKFCLILPGDAQSSRRLSESIRAGCIPVFIGPPYHSTPIAYDVDWPAMSIFFNISHYHEWMDDNFPWHLKPNSAATDGQDATWWITDTQVKKHLVHVEALSEVVPYLLRIPYGVVETKRTHVMAERAKFSFATKLTMSPNAVNVLLNGICTGYINGSLANTYVM